MSALPQRTHIRAATLDDASALAALNATGQALHARLVPELFKPVGAGTYDEQVMRRLVAQPDTTMLVAFVNGAPAGYAYAEVRRRAETPYARASSEVYLHHISLDDAFQRMGVGSALLEAVGAAGHARGIERLATEAWTSNEAAVAFFQAHRLVPYTQKLARGGWGAVTDRE